MVFHDREHEIDAIARVVASAKSELFIVYGRRGVGKSTLLAEAFASLPHLYYQATTRTLPQQLEDLTEALRAFAPDLVVAGVLPSLDGWLEALLQLARNRPESPQIVVMDELPYLAQSDPAVPTVLQRWWDRVRREGVTNLKVFLLGSIMSWMEEHTLSERGPLHNRRTGQLRLDPLDYFDAARFFPAYGSADRVKAYAIWGGLPSYLESIRPETDLWENVRASFLLLGTRLSEEPQWLRFADLRHDALYASILRAIALGEHRAGKIARAVGRSRADEIGHHLERLCDLRVVERVVPVHQTRLGRSRQALYVLADHYVAFWYRFVDRMRHLLGSRHYDEALTRIQVDLDFYVSGSAYEDVCRQYCWRALGTDRLPPGLWFDELGSWWGGREELQDQIDVVAMQDGKTVLAGECKWSTQPVGMRELEGVSVGLRKARAELDPRAESWRALFSRSGFSPGLVGHAADPANRVLLVGLEDLYW